MRSSHRWEQPLQLAYEIPDEIRMTVDGFDGLDQGPFSLLFEATHPNSLRLEIQKEDSGCLLRRPATGRSELQDSHSLDRCVMGATPGSGPLPAAVLDGQLFPKQSDLALRLLELGQLPMTTDGSAASEGHDHASQRNGMQDAGFDVLGPLPREADRWASRHDGLLDDLEGPIVTR